jgi:hypothetical protein
MQCPYLEVDCEHWLLNGKGCVKDRLDCPEFKPVKELVLKGHTRHCAIRQIFGDGECECKKGKEV